MYRFARSYSTVITQAPLQAYSSALIFSPTSSLTRQLFTSTEPEWILQKPRVEQHWNSCLTTITGLDKVWSVAFSPDGHRIVAGSLNGTIGFWDAETGGRILAVQGHAYQVWSVTFDDEGRTVISKSNDKTIKTWEAETGVCISACKGSKSPTEISTSSPDKRRHATCFSIDGTRIMNGIGVTESGSSTEVLVLRGHSNSILSVAFSPDSAYIASGSQDMTIRIWDAVTGLEISTLLGHADAVLSVNFSYDGRRIVSGSRDGTIKIWPFESNQERPPPQVHGGHLDQVNCVALSLDGCRIASGSRDRRVQIWNTKTGSSTGILQHVFQTGVSLVTLSADGHRVAASDGYRIAVSDVNRGSTISTVRRFESFTPWSSQLNVERPIRALSLGGRYVVVGSKDSVGVLNAENGMIKVQLNRSSDDHYVSDDYITSLAISTKNEHLVASASGNKTIRLWDIGLHSLVKSITLGTQIHVLRFDSSGACLYKDSSSSSDNPTLSTALTYCGPYISPRLVKNGYDIDKSLSWITWRGQNILWLPHEFRPSKLYHSTRSSDALPHMISIGCASGRVWWIMFSFDALPFPL